ncbi:hypothetical protein TVAG_362420 [Trichomonas vaginalis G3]|uniref:Uncharacterized protein n=1 Tax=Trichomonas vaginalis (strain ATCC PRA-98 / G3) TaxID=412133 RepID=A2E620_TRIV3|nr:hypothetical protein TVAGG3_0365990 [Trichomonas vaginalis G3]EAY11862.1 hypothetical protein TVAG_362420 [Trichomonas vaginalis G3]KAI5532272.1 hypothetical protein TVAGG3_0365990 [Trichomonas vaginalis G3]|eukprot:XP_001324085.1 hypothetical protein [Trichomonas vaginalis G3]
MNFDQFLATVKKYAIIFATGFLAGVIAYLIQYVIDHKSIDLNLYKECDLYLMGLTCGILYIIETLCEYWLLQIKFIKSIHDQLRPVFYSIVAILVVAILYVFTIPFVRIYHFPKAYKALAKHASIPRIIDALWGGYQKKYTNTVPYMMIRMPIDSIFWIIHSKYLRSAGNKYVSVAVYALCMAVSAIAAGLAVYPIESTLAGNKFDHCLHLGIEDAIVMIPIVVVLSLVDGGEKSVSFSLRL